MIPHLLHHIWLGPRPVPDWHEAWREMHPSWHQRIWREADIDALHLANRRAYDHYMSREEWSGAANVARVEILLAHGGLYVDIDSQPLQPFDAAPFMTADVFAAYEPVATHPGRVANGTIGAVRAHPVLRSYRRAIREMECLEPSWDTTGGTALTAMLLLHRRCCDVRVLPSRVFYPRDAFGRLVPGAETSYCDHFWATTNMVLREDDRYVA